MERVLFVTNSLHTFVKIDLDILKGHCDTKVCLYKGQKSIWRNLLNQIIQFFWFLLNIHRAKAIYIWFADYHSLMPVLFSKLFSIPSYLVIGGYDVASIPEIRYGSFSNPVRSFFARNSIKHATLNLPVADTLVEDIYKYVPSARVKVVYTGYDAELFTPGNMRKENYVLTVGTAESLQRIKIKGFDFFIKIAKKLPDIKFIIIGIKSEVLNKYLEVPSNVEIVDRISQKELISYYQKAKVYAQFSVREGLPNVVCEAMLCECIPVGFNNGGIPIAIGDAGFVIETSEIDQVEETIMKALQSDEKLAQKSRQRVIDNFSLDQRRMEILAVINKASIN